MTTLSLAEALQQAVDHHNAGRVREAEQMYRGILSAQPRNAQATYLLGLLALQVGKPQVALDIVSQAIRLEGGHPQFHATLGEALRGLNRTADAITSYRQALRLKPDFAEAHNNLGTLLESIGDAAAAEASYRAAIDCSSGSPSGYSDPHHNLGNLCQQQGRRDEAVDAFRRAVELNPGNTASRLSLASVLQSLGRSDAAIAEFEAVHRTSSQTPQAHLALGAGLQGSGNYEAAVANYRRAIEIDPYYADAYYNLGTALHALERDAEAVDAYTEAIRHSPGMTLAWSNLANVLVGLVRPDQAACAARQAKLLQPRSGSVMGNLAAALQLQGDMPGAIDAYRQAAELSQSGAGNHSNLIYTLNFHPDYDDQKLFDEHLDWARRHAEPLTAAAAPHDNDRDPARRLKVGYVSAHFRHHAVAFFAEPLLLNHDPAQVELACYAAVAHPDETTERFRRRSDIWRNITKLEPAEIAEQIRGDQIDILVDLDGHIGGNRLLAFAHKPAPVQVTYLGYQNTTGMSAMDYRLTDAHADPPGVTDRWYAEKLVRLPRSFFCYAPPERSPEVNELPALRGEYITLASLNHIHKITPRALRTWAEILRRVPKSRLMILAYTPGVFEANVQAVLAEEGIDAGRVEVVNKRPRYEYLEMHGQIDLALDTFPFNGHTTVCDALWMGVPSIMLEGSRYASRFGGSTLLGVGLAELIAHSVEQYVELAVGLAQDTQRLAELRRTLRERLATSGLVDGPAFARDVEAAYRQMWQSWCAG